ncbi:MAG: hypothetical protein IPO12_13910 [Flavobacteriales bacterium]|nr:hypothetical protein [Flavobacteriales bacterium]
MLRDLVTSGDALRIRMPFLPEEHQQWLWVENHQTYALNGSPTDRFHWEDTNNPCIASTAWTFHDDADPNATTSAAGTFSAATRTICVP